MSASIERAGIAIDDTFAEAFGMKATRIIITAATPAWAHQAAITATGFATSVIGCGCEAGIERTLRPGSTPDARPGVSILLFAVSTKELEKQVERRVAQCILTCPTTAAFAGITGEKSIGLGKSLRYFGDGWQMSKKLGGERYWRVPVMDGEFLVQEKTGIVPAVGGGNLIIAAKSIESALTATEAAVKAMRRLPNVIMPFPGGIVRSGSKVGSRYPALSASTNDAYCPTLRGATVSQLDERSAAALEIVIDGLEDTDVAAAMRAGIGAICALGAASGITRISAGNYGGKLGQFHFHLKDLL